MITKKQLFDLTELLVIGSVTTTGFLIGGTIGASVMAGLGINLAANLIGSGSEKLKSKWVESKDGILNQDIQKALLRAYLKSLTQLQDIYLNLDEVKEISKREKKEIIVFFNMLLETAKEAFIPNIKRSIKEQEIQKYLLSDSKEGEKLLWERINSTKLLNKYNHHFRSFLKNNLLSEIKFWFGEELKTDNIECNKAWRAFQRLLLEGIKDDINSLKTGQDYIKTGLQKLANLESKIAKLRNVIDKRESDEPFQINLDEILSSLNNIAGLSVKTEKKIDDLKYYLEKENYRFQNYIENSQIKDISLNLAIPSPPEVLIGRENLTKSILQKITQGKSISLHGMAGIGKTSISSSIASLFQKNGEKVLWIKAGKNTSNNLCDEIARRFEEQTITNLTLEDKYEKIRTLLFKYNITLIVLDDVWNISAARDFYKQSIPTGCRVIVTGRKRVGIGYPYDILPLEQNDSEKLFRYHSNIEVTINVRNICHLLGEHPMALELAGKILWINSITIKDLEERLKDSTNKLKNLSLSNATHENMWATLFTSYETLNKDEQKVFCAFGSLWNTSATLEMLSMITGIDQIDTAKILQTLISNSLVKVEKSVDNITIHRIHDLTYDLANTLVLKKKTNWKVKALKSCVNYANKYSAQDKKDHDRLEAEKTNLLLSASYAFDNSSFDLVNEMALSLYEKGEFLRWRGCVLESIALLEKAVISTEKLNKTIPKGKHLGNLGIAYRQIGQIEKSIKYHKKALAVMMFNKNKEGESDALGEIGWAYHRLGNSEEAIKCLKRALSICKNINDRRWESIWLGTLGRVYKDLGKIEEAIDCHQTAYQIMVDIGNERGQGARIGELGWDYEVIGENEKAYACYEKALEISQNISDNRREGVWLASIGAVLIKKKNFDLSEKYLNRALKIAKKIEHKTNEANIYMYFGELYSNRCKYDEALGFLYLSLSIYKETHQKREVGKCWHLLGLNYKNQLVGDKGNLKHFFDKALNAFYEAIKIKMEINDFTLNDTKKQIEELKLSNFVL